MQYKLFIPLFILSLLFHSTVGAQTVLYSSAVSNDMQTSFEVIGKAGNFYWAYKIRKNGGPAWPPKEERSFEVYDARLNHVKEIPTDFSDSVLKQYLIPQRYSFDQVIFKKSLHKTSVLVNRFAQDGSGPVKNAHLFDLPGEMALEDILVTRSPDRTKILLLGFVRAAANVTPDLYARVYTGNWELLHETVYTEGNLVQPFVQYNVTEYVLESSDASPVKITNNGDWLMVAPARRANNYLLCHFKTEDSSFIQTGIQQPQNGGTEFCSLSVEEGKDAYIGILQNLTPADRSVRMMHYNLADRHFSYDTAYRFHLPNAYKKREEYQFEEAFIQIPGKGFMYMKEYGRRYFTNFEGEEIMLDNEQQYAAYGTHKGRLQFNENEYTRNSDLSDTKKRFERGDLSVKYFPFQPADSCWGGLLHVEQAAQLRYADLSYACVSSGDKIIFLYNSLAKNDHKVSSTTVLDRKGQPVDEGVIFWRPANVLDFQKARLIHPDELSVPFDRNGVQGFAVIRF